MNYDQLLGAAFEGKRSGQRKAAAEAERQRKEANDGATRGWAKNALQGATAGFMMGGGPFGAALGAIAGAGLGLYSSAKDRKADNGGSMWKALGASVADPFGGQGAGDTLSTALPLAAAYGSSKMEQPVITSGSDPGIKVHSNYAMSNPHTNNMNRLMRGYGGMGRQY